MAVSNHCPLVAQWLERSAVESIRLCLMTMDEKCSAVTERFPVREAPFRKSRVKTEGSTSLKPSVTKQPKPLRKSGRGDIFISCKCTNKRLNS